MSSKRPDAKNTVPRRLSLPGKQFESLVKTLVDKQASVRFRAAGNSMFPNILDGDILTLSPYQNKVPQIGDVVCLSGTGFRQMFIHRIVKKSGPGFLVKGDNVFRCDGMFHPSHMIGYVIRLERNGKTIPIRSATNRRHAILSKLRIFSLRRLIMHSGMTR